MNLTFLNTKDITPKHDSQIVFIKSSEDSFFESFEFEFGRVEYNWDDGNGCSICYDENNPEPPESDDKEHPFRLAVSIDGYDCGLFANKDEQNKTQILWAYYDDVFDEINKSLT